MQGNQSLVGKLLCLQQHTAPEGQTSMKKGSMGGKGMTELRISGISPRPVCGCGKPLSKLQGLHREYIQITETSI